MNRIFYLFVSMIWFSYGGYAQKTGTWGDQGDGTYKNPVLNANYPDTDIERLGDTWYMISSTSMMAPGMTILESKDLVNWKITGNVFQDVSWRKDYLPGQMSDLRGGVWAGDLVYHEGKWLCYVIDPEFGLYVSEAKHIKGPWTKPVLMKAKQAWTDPCVFFDKEKKQGYLLCHYATEKKNNLFENRIFKLSWDGKALQDTGKVVYTGRGAEAAKAYKVKGYYYIFISEWIKEKGKGADRKQLVLRSKTIEGPYEKRIVLEKGNGCNRSCCQGSLIETPDGNWWYMHQLVQSKDSYEGRPQFLIPVRWEEGWPVLGIDSDGNGVGNTVWEWKKPLDGASITAPQTDDDFEDSTLSPQWAWYYTPDYTKWSLKERPGYLRMKAVKPLKEDDFLKTPNILSQRKMGKGCDTVTVKMDLKGMVEGQEAGISHFATYYFNLGVVKKGQATYGIIENQNGTVMSLGTIDSDAVWLRCLMNQDKGIYEYSTDGKHFIRSKQEFIITAKGFKGDRIGIYNVHKAGRGYVDVDWFRYSYNGPKE